MFPVSQNNNMAQAYDRSITVFSPEGHLYQVDYASKIIEKGSPAVAITYKDGIIIVADKKIFSSLIIPESVEKVFKIDQHVWIACSGLIGDGRRLVDFARQIAQENKTYYDDPIEIETLVKKVASIVQYYTQYGGARPFGVSIITAGIDTLGKHIYETEPSGATTAYKAVAIGQNRPKLLAHLEKNYKPNMSFDDALKLAIKTITLNLEPKQKLEADNIEVINITEDERKAIVPQDKYSKLIWINWSWSIMGKILKPIKNPKTYGAKAAKELRENKTFNDLHQTYKILNKVDKKNEQTNYFKNQLNLMIGRARLRTRFEKNPVLLKDIQKHMEKIIAANMFQSALSNAEKSKVILKVMTDINKLPDSKVLDYIKDVENWYRKHK